MLIFLGEMGAISPDIYEAAMIDGATAGQADRYVSHTVNEKCIWNMRHFSFRC